MSVNFSVGSSMNVELQSEGGDWRRRRQFTPHPILASWSIVAEGQQQLIIHFLIFESS